MSGYWRLVMALAALWAALAVSVVVAGEAFAEHAPEGSGACDDHTVTCYPECRHEWGAKSSNSLGGATEIERDYCPVGPEYVEPQAVAEATPVTEVAVSNQPTHTTVVCADGEVCEQSATSIENATMSGEVLVTNGDENAVPVSPAANDIVVWLVAPLLFTAGLLAGGQLFRMGGR